VLASIKEERAKMPGLLIGVGWCMLKTSKEVALKLLSMSKRAYAASSGYLHSGYQRRKHH
jgi:hypothetical protein